jgi:hypothetical protein
MKIARRAAHINTANPVVSHPSNLAESWSVVDLDTLNARALECSVPSKHNVAAMPADQPSFCNRPHRQELAIDNAVGTAIVFRPLSPTSGAGGCAGESEQTPKTSNPREQLPIYSPTTLGSLPCHDGTFSSEQLNFNFDWWASSIRHFWYVVDFEWQESVEIAENGYAFLRTLPTPRLFLAPAIDPNTTIQTLELDGKTFGRLTVVCKDGRTNAGNVCRATATDGRIFTSSSRQVRALSAIPSRAAPRNDRGCLPTAGRARPRS